MGFETEAIERIQTGPPDSKANNAFITLHEIVFVFFETLNLIANFGYLLSLTGF